MESNPNEDDSKSSSEEETDDNMGTGRSYECAFCKGGFTTAQALGGHMNIHRKDKAKNRPEGSSSSSPSSTSDKFIDDNNSNNNHASFRSFSPTSQSYHPTTHNHHHQYINYQTYYPHQYSTINNYDSYGKNIHQQLNLGLRVGESHHHHHHHHVAAHVDHDKEKRQGVSEEDEVLDLELRLGHNDP